MFTYEQLYNFLDTSSVSCSWLFSYVYSGPLVEHVRSPENSSMFGAQLELLSNCIYDRKKMKSIHSIGTCSLLSNCKRVVVEKYVSLRRRALFSVRAFQFKNDASACRHSSLDCSPWIFSSLLTFVNTTDYLFIDFDVLNKNMLSVLSCGYWFSRNDILNFLVLLTELQLYSCEYFPYN